MSLLFKIPGAHTTTVAELCEDVGADGLVFVRGPAPDLGAPWPAAITFVARRGVTTRPVEVSATEEALHVRLLTNGACPETSRLGIALAAAAARRAGTSVHTEEGLALDADALLAHHDDAWCRAHAAFGLTALATAFARHPERFASMPTHQGSLLLSRSRYEALSGDHDALFDALRRRAWVELLAAAAPLAVEAHGGTQIPVRRVALGQTCHIDHQARWLRCDGLDGLVLREQLVAALGDRVQIVDEGCAILPELSESDAATLRDSLTPVKDPEVLAAAPGLPDPVGARALDDLALVDGARCAVRAEDALAAHTDALDAFARAHADRLPRLDQWTPEAVTALPADARAELALGPLLAALLVVAADGTIDRKERSTLARLVVGLETDEAGPGLLWRAAFPDGSEAWQAVVPRADQWLPRLVNASLQLSAHVRPEAREPWLRGVRDTARAAAEASGGGWFGLFGSKVSAEERQALSIIDEVLEAAAQAH